MQTRCPECSATYQVTHAQLMAAHGLVRCGKCHTLFDGKLMILRTEHQENEDDAEEPGSAATDTPAFKPGPALANKLPAAASKPEIDDESADDDYDLEALVSLFNEDNNKRDKPKSIPVLLSEELNPDTQRISYSKRSTIGWSFAIIIMLGVLVGQYIVFEHIELSRYPLAHRICEALNCELEPPRDLAMIELLHRGVTTHPELESALVITATIRNNAEFAQPYPGIQIALDDLQGETLALRRFSPEEYLPDQPEQTPMLTPGGSGSLKLEVWDPGTDVLAYAFDFF